MQTILPLLTAALVLSIINQHAKASLPFEECAYPCVANYYFTKTIQCLKCVESVQVGYRTCEIVCGTEMADVPASRRWLYRKVCDKCLGRERIMRNICQSSCDDNPLKNVASSRLCLYCEEMTVSYL